MLKAITTVAAGVLLALSSQPLMAVGFGRLVNATSLGQMLDVTVALSADTTEQITADCVSADVAVGGSVLPHPLVRVRLEPSGTAGIRSLRVTTTVRIIEPVVHVTVATACPSRISREFVVLVDPPLAAPEPVVAAADLPAAATAPASGASAASGSALPEMAIARGGSEAAVDSGVLAAKSDRSSPASTRRTSKSSASKATSTSSQMARRSQAAAARKTRRGSTFDARVHSVPRLELERGTGALSTATVSAAAPVAVEPAAAMPAASGSTAVSANAGGPTGEAQREAIQSLQMRVDKLQSESDASSRSIAQLQARLREAEASRTTGWFAYAQAAGGAVLLLWIGLLVGRRNSTSRSGLPWWNGDTGSVSPRPGETTVALKPVFVPSAMASLPDALEISDDTPTTDPVPLVIAEPSPPFGAEPAAPPSVLTADELIDLEQQAEFFVALGQDDSAVDLLNAFLRGSGGASPLPYLKLLEIHRRRGERNAYDRIRERHERRFGNSSPTWADEPVTEGAIEDHPQVMRQIESVWANPPEAMKLIESLLVSDDRSASLLDLASLTDLQFLYLLARSVREVEDLAAQDVPEPTVDLLLPLSHLDDPRSVVEAATRSASISGENGATVDSGFSSRSDIDLELDLVPPPAETKRPA
ncbi:MAG: FimV family protein [Rhizobacter sp.]